MTEVVVDGNEAKLKKKREEAYQYAS